MDKYEEYMNLLGELKSYFNKDDIISNEKVISAYDLYVIVLDKLEKLRYVNQELNNIKNEINVKYTSKKAYRCAKIRRMIGREALYYEYQCAYFNYKVGNDKTEISFAFRTENYFYHIVICKDFGSNEIYFDKDLKPRCEIDKKIIMKY